MSLLFVDKGVVDEPSASAYCASPEFMASDKSTCIRQEKGLISVDKCTTYCNTPLCNGPFKTPM